MSILIEKINKWAAANPNKICLSFVDDSGSIVNTLTYLDLQRKTLKLAKYIAKDLGLVGKTVIIAYPPSIDLILAIIASIRAGAIPVLTHAVPIKILRDFDKFVEVCKSCGAKVALTNLEYDWETKMHSAKAQFPTTSDFISSSLQWVVTDKIFDSAENEIYDNPYSMVPSHETNVAFLQYLSCSNRNPQGIMISHGNIAHNLTLFNDLISFSQDTVVIGWLSENDNLMSFFSYFSAFVSGGSVFCMPSVAFWNNPSLWIYCVSKYRGTLLQASDFAYALTAKCFLEASRKYTSAMRWIKDLDLSCVQCMLNATEPVSRGTMDLFEGVFRDYGLPSQRFAPVYTLPHHTAIVLCKKMNSSGSDEGENKTTDLRATQAGLLAGRYVAAIEDALEDFKANMPQPITLCSYGQVNQLPGMTLLIVAAGEDNGPGRVLEEDSIGEVWIHSPSIITGHLPGNDKETHLNWGRVTCDRYFNKDFLRTGDVGFIHNRQLYLWERNCDHIYAHGRYHHTQDIEETVEAVSLSHGSRPYVRLGSCMAFEICKNGGYKGLAVVAELAEEPCSSRHNEGFYEQAMAQISTEISAKHGLCVIYIALIRPTLAQDKSDMQSRRRRTRRLVLNKCLDGIISSYEGYEWNASNIVGANIGRSYQNKHLLPSYLDDELSICIPRLEPRNDIPSKKKPINITASDDTERIWNILIAEVANCLQSRNLTRLDCGIDSYSSLGELGFDASLRTKLRLALEAQFHMSLPEILTQDPDCTLKTIKNCLASGGRIRVRPSLVRAWELIPALHDAVRPALETGYDIKKNSICPQGVYDMHTVSRASLAKCSEKTDAITGKFRNGVCKNERDKIAPLDTQDQHFIYKVHGYLAFLGNDLLMFCLRSIVYLSALLLFMHWKSWHAKALLIGALFFMNNYPHRLFNDADFIYATNLATFQMSRFLKVLCDYFSYHFIIEEPLQANIPTLLLVKGLQATQVVHRKFLSNRYIYFTEDVPVLHMSISLTILHTFIRFLHGFEMWTFLPDVFAVGATGYNNKAVSSSHHTFLNKYLSQALYRIGLKGNLSNPEIVDTVIDYTYSEVSEGSIPHVSMLYDCYNKDSGDILQNTAEANLHAIRLALMLGYQIVPSLHLQSSESNSRGNDGLPRRTILTMVTGKPIQCPRMVPRGSVDLSPITDELVMEFHVLYQKEIRRMAQRYANIFEDARDLAM